jgi:hypothetical protein
MVRGFKIVRFYKLLRKRCVLLAALLRLVEAEIMNTYSKGQLIL